MRIFILALCFCLNHPSSAEIVRATASNFVITRSISLDQLIDNAGLIFRGRVTKIEYQISNGLNIRKVSFAVTDPIKGLSGNQITISEWASIRSPLSSPLMRKQDHVFFFHKPSAKGLTSLVGMEQGLVSIGGQRISLRHGHKIQVANIQETSDIKFSSKAQVKPEVNTYEDLKQYCEARTNAS